MILTLDDIFFLMLSVAIFQCSSTIREQDLIPTFFQSGSDTVNKDTSKEESKDKDQIQVAT